MKSRTGKYSEAELIDFLRKKVNGDSDPLLPVDILKSDLYGADEPWVIFGTRTENELYFFTEVTKKTINGKRYNRTAGAGHWKEDNGHEDVSDDQKNVVGQRKSFRFELHDRSLPENEFKWTMQELKLNDYPAQYEQNNELVICRVLRCAHDSLRRRPAEEKLKRENINNTSKRKLEKVEHDNNRVICGLPAAARKNCNYQVELCAVMDVEENSSEDECKELDIEGFTNALKSQYVVPDEEQEGSLVENKLFMDNAGRGDNIEDNKTVMYKNWITGCELISNNENTDI